MDMVTELANFFKALGDDTRLRLVMLLLRQRPGTAMCVTRLARELDTTPPNVSQHLRVLKDLGLVYGERRRYRIHYYLDAERLASYYELARSLWGEAFTLEQEIW